MGDPELHPRLEHLLGSTLAGRYRVDGVIGAGGMGIVFSGRQLNLKREVAIKVLDPEVAADEVGHRRFAREAESAGRLDHPNCLAVYDYGTTDGMHYIVMPRLYGRTLRAELTAPTTFSRCLEIFDEILAGLEHAHAAGVIHRDLKPANVFLSRDAAGSQTVKLLDFGIAKIVDSEADGSFATRTGLLFGTPAYMSPEQATGEPTDARTDLYSAGIILYRMLTGAIPNAGRSAVDQMRKRASLDVPRLPEPFPDALADLCQSLCEREAQDRCPSATVARSGLAAVMAETPELDLNNLWASGVSHSASSPDDVTRDEAAYRSIASNGFSVASAAVEDAPTPAEVIDTDEQGDRRAWFVAAIAVSISVVAAVVVALNRNAEDPTDVQARTAPPVESSQLRSEPQPTQDSRGAAQPAPEVGTGSESSTEMGVELLRDITAVNEADPSEALAFHERHARIAALRSVDATVPLLDERIIAAMDLVQAEQSDSPCETFRDALHDLAEFELEPVMPLLREASVPQGDQEACIGLGEALDELTQPKRRPKRPARSGSGDDEPRANQQALKDPGPGDLQGKVTPKLGDDELR